jgi:hypothetical protein
MKGGKREGAGRPIGPPTYTIRLRLPLSLHEQILAVGGNAWVKAVVLKELAKMSVSIDLQATDLSQVLPKSQATTPS